MTTQFEVTLPNGKIRKLLTYEGLTFEEEIVNMMDAKDFELQMTWVRETPIRDDDIIICAYPKTGTHWSWEIANMVQRGAAEYHKDTKEIAFLDFCNKEMTSTMTSPRVLNTHLTHNLLPAGIKEKKCKIIHVMRNPKDVVVSLYFHLLNEQGADISHPFDLFSKMFRGEYGGPLYCSYMWYLRHWEQFQIDNPDYPLLNLYYEDMKKDPEAEIKKIAMFLEKDIDETLVKEISTKCNFQNMKDGHAQKNDHMADKTVTGNTSYMYRKGDIGDWKNHLTVAENEEYDKWIEDGLKGSKFKFQFE